MVSNVQMVVSPQIEQHGRKRQNRVGTRMFGTINTTLYPLLSHREPYLHDDKTYRQLTWIAGLHLGPQPEP